MSPRGRAYGAAAALLPHPPLGQESFRSRVRPPAHGPRAKAQGEGAGRRQIPGCGKKRRDPARFSFQEPERRWSSTIGPTRHPAIGTGQGCKLGSRLKAQAGAEALKPHLRCARPSTPSAVIDRWRRLRQRGGSAIFGGIATDKACNRSLAPALCIGLMHRPYALALCIGLMHVMFRRAGAGPTSKPWPINPGP